MQHIPVPYHHVQTISICTVGIKPNSAASLSPQLSLDIQVAFKLRPPQLALIRMVEEGIKEPLAQQSAQQLMASLAIQEDIRQMSAVLDMSEDSRHRRSFVRGL